MSIIPEENIERTTPVRLAKRETYAKFNSHSVEKWLSKNGDKHFFCPTVDKNQRKLA